MSLTVSATENSESPRTTSVERGTRVFTKRLQSPGVIHQACLGKWTLDCPENAVEVVFGKSSYLSLHRFTVDTPESTESHPTGRLELIHEQPVFGVIKDMKTIQCRFEPEVDDPTEDKELEGDQEMLEEPAIDTLPSTTTSDMLVCTSDSGYLSFIAYHNKPTETIPTISDFANSSINTGRFIVVKEIPIATPGSSLHSYGAHLAVDPTSRVIATSSMQGHIKLFFLQPTKKSTFEPVEKEVEIILLKGSIIQMDFLAQDEEDIDKFADLAVLFFDDNYGQHQIATFHISLRKFRRTPSFQVGQSFVTSDDSLATMHMRALPHYPRALVYVDEEKITLVTIPKASPTTHNHHPPLYLLKREPSARELGEEARSQESSKSHEEYPFISALAPSPGIALTDEQIIYLGSPTSEIYRIHLDTITNEMQYEMVSGERSVGKVMTVLAKQTFYREEEEDDMPGRMTSTLYSTDFLLYSNEQGDGGVLAIREDRDCVSPFAVETLQSDSPILDFSLREPSIPGRDCIYACSGMREEGSLLRIRSGIATESSGSSSNPYFAGTVGMWAFALKEADDFDSFLVISFVQSTKVMFNGEEGSLEDISEKSGFILNHSTLLAGRIQDGAIFQVHREGVLVVWPDTGRKYTWQCSGEIVTTADLVAPGVIVLGMVTETNQSSLKVLQLSHTEDSDIPGTFETIAETNLREELTTIYCWSSTPHAEDGQEVSTTRYCCIGTLEPSLVVFKLEGKRIREVYRESLAINATQKQREHVTIPQALCIVEAPAQPNADPHKRSYNMLVGLRDGTMLAYGWHPATSDMPSESPKMLSLPQLFKIGILPVKFVTRPCSSSSLHPNVLPTAVLVIADGIWKAQMKSSRLEIDTVLFDGEVTHACSFHYYGPDSDITSCFAFVVNHNDLQIVTVGKHKEFNHHPSIVFGETPRRLLDITSKKLMLVATVGNKFPADESRLKLIDPDTPLEVTAGTTSEEHDEEQAPVTSEFRLKKGEMVCCMVEWKVSKANKTDAVYICIGTAQFSTTDDKSSLGIPKAGRLVAFSIKQNKKAERKDQRYELEQRWSMPMQAPVYAVAPLLDKYLLVSVGPYLKLLTLDPDKKSLNELTSYLERWPISHISTVGNYIYTGSRKESISLYEFQPSVGDQPERLNFLKSARTARMISDCQALSAELTVAADVTGGFFGVGYAEGDPSCQHSLRDEFAIHLGEVICRIRCTKLWPGVNERSMRGLFLSQDHGKKSQEPLSQLTQLENMAPPVTFQQMVPWVFLPWATSTVLQDDSLTANSLSPANSPQALVACSHLGSIWGFWRLQPSVYQALHRLQEILQTLYHTRPILGQEHDRFRSISGPMENVIDGELILQFLDLELALQLEAIEQSAGTVESYLRQWIESVPMTTEERQVFDDYAQALADKYPAVAAYVFAKNRVEEEEEEEADGDSLVHDSCTKEPTRSSSETLENISDSPNASQESVASTPKNLPRTSQEVEDEDEEMQLDDTVEATGDEVVATEPDPAEVLKLWWAFGTLHNLLEFLRSLQWHQ